MVLISEKNLVEIRRAKCDMIRETKILYVHCTIRKLDLPSLFVWLLFHALVIINLIMEKYLFAGL